MGFLEYAWSLSLEKDPTKTRLLVSPKIKFPKLMPDEGGYVCILPEPKVEEINEDKEEKTLSLMGYRFPADVHGKRQLVSLFRAAVFHLTAHTVSSGYSQYGEWKTDKDERLARFVASIIEDAKVNKYLSSDRDKIADIVLANTLALKRLRRINILINPATKIMAGLLVEINTGLNMIESKKERAVIDRLSESLRRLKDTPLISGVDMTTDIKKETLTVADQICDAIESGGILAETPFLPHTEDLGSCSIFHPTASIDSDVSLDVNFKRCLEFLDGALLSGKEGNGAVRRIAEAEAMQIYDSWKHQKRKDKQTVTRYQSLIASTSFKGVEIPQQDYSKFSRVRTTCKSEAHRLLETLIVARDAIDEDPRKVYGVLDLQEVIQVIASKSPRMDVFMLDENISKSYSWIILLDASKSMNCVKDFALELFTVLAEVANELLIDPTSWAMYAFNDRLLVIKDPKERYNMRVKSRIGGIEFDGFTCMPDALQVAGQMIKPRAENLRLITIISDGWPFGHTSPKVTLAATLDALEKRNISVVGIGAKSRKMESIFKTPCTVYTLRDLTKKFSNLYLGASRIAVET